jgi:hypothetical protein
MMLIRFTTIYCAYLQQPRQQQQLEQKDEQKDERVFACFSCDTRSGVRLYFAMRLEHCDVRRIEHLLHQL